MEVAHPVILTLSLAVALGCGAGNGSARGETGKPDSAPGSSTIEVGGATLTVEMGDVDEEEAERLEAWVRRSAELVAEYCDGFPVPTLRVQLRTRSGSGVGFGQHFDGRLVRVRVGHDTSEADLRRDWVMVHEMLHTAMPHLRRRHRWMMEGLSTYLESVLRVRAGVMTEEEIWTRWVGALPNGLPPRRERRGLDGWRSWGAVYWGGALYWLAVDVEIQRRTRGRRSLRDAVRGILARGGNSRVTWSTDRVVAVADEISGTTAAADVYESMARRPSRMDLPAFFRRLGVIERDDGEVVVTNQAPLAYVRRGIMER